MDKIDENLLIVLARDAAIQASKSLSKLCDQHVVIDILGAKLEIKKDSSYLYCL